MPQRGREVLRQAEAKQKKGAESLDLPTDRIEEELEINRVLRRMMNPHADEDAGGKDAGQLDIEDEIEGATETGGATKTRLTTPPAPTDEELRDQILAIGLTMALADIRALTRDERSEVTTWLGQVVAANTIGGTVPDEPLSIANGTMSNDRVEELLECGPYGVRVNAEQCFEIVHRETTEVDDTLVDVFDAGLRAARLNLNVLRNADISAEDVERFAFMGPWMPGDDGDGRYWIEAGAQNEACESFEDATSRSARYNRAIAAKRDDGWTEPEPVRIDEDDVQEIKAATEHDAAVVTE